MAQWQWLNQAKSEIQYELWIQRNPVLWNGIEGMLKAGQYAVRIASFDPPTSLSSPCSVLSLTLIGEDL